MKCMNENDILIWILKTVDFLIESIPQALTLAGLGRVHAYDLISVNAL